MLHIKFLKSLALQLNRFPRWLLLVPPLLCAKVASSSSAADYDARVSGYIASSSLTGYYPEPSIFSPSGWVPIFEKSSGGFGRHPESPAFSRDSGADSAGSGSAASRASLHSGEVSCSASAAPGVSAYNSYTRAWNYSESDALANASYADWLTFDSAGGMDKPILVKIKFRLRMRASTGQNVGSGPRPTGVGFYLMTWGLIGTAPGGSRGVEIDNYYENNGTFLNPFAHDQEHEVSVLVGGEYPTGFRLTVSTSVGANNSGSGYVRMSDVSIHLPEGCSYTSASGAFLSGEAEPLEKADPGLIWATPQAIQEGTPLTWSQLNARASVKGDYTYDPPEGTVLTRGANQVLTVTFTPFEDYLYNSATASVSLDVLNSETKAFFDAIRAPYFLIEAEDFNFGGGQAESAANTMPLASGVYERRSAIHGVDYHVNDLRPEEDHYRWEEYPNVPLPISNTDLYRGQFTLTSNYRLGWTDSGEWFNYTRNFPSATYRIYGALSKEGGNMGGRIALVENPTSETQTITEVGTFLAAATGGWGLNRIVPLKGADGQPVELTLSGPQTLRFTSDQGEGDLDFLVLVSTVESPKSLPLINWAAPEPIQEGTPLTGEQLNAYSPVPGHFEFSPAAGTVLPAGNFQTLSATFIPNNTDVYESVTVRNSIDVLPSGTKIFFDSITDSYFLVEAEDFNFARGQATPEASVMPLAAGTYQNRSAVHLIDYRVLGDHSEGDSYRAGETPNVPLPPNNTDLYRGTFTLSSNYRIGWLDQGEWFNYTRYFPPGTYRAYAALSKEGTGTMGGLLSLLGSPDTATPMIADLGTFQAEASGRWGLNRLVPLKGIDGNEVDIPLSGTQTLRFTSDFGQGDLDFLVFVLQPRVNSRPEATSFAGNHRLYTFADTQVFVTLSGSDADGDHIEFELRTSPEHGTIIGTPPNLRYLPNAGFHGRDSFTYQTYDELNFYSPVATIEIEVLPGGALMLWGDNSSGQLGTGTGNVQENAPVFPAPFPGSSQVARVSAGLRFNSALTASSQGGHLVTWGEGEDGQLGDGQFIDRNLPVAIFSYLQLLLSDRTPVHDGSPYAIVCGAYHALLLWHNGLFSWGQGNAGQLGTGSTQTHGILRAIDLPEFRQPVAVAAGNLNSYAIASDGTVWAWGFNGNGELGDGSVAFTRSYPGQVVLPGNRVATTLSAGSSHCLVLASDGTLWAWGLNNHGQLGDGTTETRRTPVQVAALPGGRAITAIAGGFHHSLALASDGSVWSWGNLLPLGRTAASSTMLPGQVTGIPGNLRAVAIAAGQSHSMALLEDGNIAAWGGNSQGQLGIGTAVQSAPPTLVRLPANKRAVAIASGQTHSVAIVREVPAAPVAKDDSLDVLNTPAGVLLDVLANDSDPNGDPIFIASWSNPQKGTVQAIDNQAFIYFGEPGFVGEDYFFYGISDGTGGLATAKVTLNVKAPDRPPIAIANGGQDLYLTANSACSAIVTLDASGSHDPDGDPLTYAWTVRDGNNTIIFTSTKASDSFESPLAHYTAELKVSSIRNGWTSQSTTSSQITVSPGAPRIDLMTPATAMVGMPFELIIGGGCMPPGSEILWSGQPVITQRRFLNNQWVLTANFAAPFYSIQFLEPVSLYVHVAFPDGRLSAPVYFIIIPTAVGNASAAIVSEGESVALSARTANNESGLDVNAINTGGQTLTVLAATYNTPPVTPSFFELPGGTCVDLQVTGADRADFVQATFYYPPNIPNEENLTLRFLDGQGQWVEVLNPFGLPVFPDTRDNLNGTLSGGSFAVVFNDSSTPKSWELNGTVFAMFDPAPQILSVAATPEPLPVHNAASAVVEFATANTGAVCDVTFNWGDGSTTTVRTQTGAADATHAYARAGVYSVTISVREQAGAITETVHNYVVIYDPEAGFVTGGGWINSPAGAYLPDASIAGKAHFGFVSQYKKGATVPTGNTQFQLSAAGFEFLSSSYDWLVVAGAKAQFKGRGTVNGGGLFGFLITAQDGAKIGSPDRIRMKIWDLASGTVVYDNASGADGLDNSPIQPLGAGNIVIHGK
jgi:alpha-tubulin suppressor-like RCC1 family protein/PKD repeat protein